MSGSLGATYLAAIAGSGVTRLRGRFARDSARSHISITAEWLPFWRSLAISLAAACVDDDEPSFESLKTRRPAAPASARPRQLLSPGLFSTFRAKMLMRAIRAFDVSRRSFSWLSLALMPPAQPHHRRESFITLSRARLGLEAT